MVINVSTLPANTADAGRYRLVVGRVGGTNFQTRAEMLMLDPQGNVVWRGLMNSGGQGNGALPGLNANLAGRGIVAEYPIDMGNSQLSRNDAGFTRSDGSTGFSINLQNASNMSEIGGAGRDLFRIHTGGRAVGTHGCLEFLDNNGQVNANADRQSASFLAALRNIPTNQRPRALEVLNPSLVNGGAPSRTPATPGMTLISSSGGTSQNGRTAEDEAEETRRRQRDLEGQLNPNGDQGILGMIFGFLRFLFETFLGGADNQGEDDPAPTAPAPTTAMAATRALVDSRALPRWQEFQESRRGQSVSFSSPVAGASVITSNFGYRSREATRGIGSTDHKGVDIGARGNDSTPDILAAADGVVLFAGRARGYGNAVVIGHADGSQTVYGHLSSVNAQVGNTVRGGQRIGVMGNEGNSTGTHLHFEVRRANASGTMVAVRPEINGRSMTRGIALNGTELPNLPGVTGGQTPSEAPAAPARVAVARTTGITIGGVRLT